MLLQLLVLDNFKASTQWLKHGTQQTSDFSIQPQKFQDLESKVERGETEREGEAMIGVVEKQREEPDDLNKT